VPPTYPGILLDNQIAWSGEEPPVPPGRAVRVVVTLLEAAESSSEQGQEMAAVLERLAALPANEDLSDPVAWQRETRQDRPLPGREE